MRIAIKNNNKKSHTICAPGGSKVDILPNNYVVLHVEEDRDLLFWDRLKDEVAERYGLKIIRDEDLIDKLESEMSVSISDGYVSPIAKEIAEGHDNTSDNGFYTEEQLLQMDKEDLFNLCDNFNIDYDRNSSVKTLVALIMEVIT